MGRKVCSIMSKTRTDSDIDILGVSESWLTHVNISGYDVFRESEGRGGGGSLVYVKSNLKCEHSTRPTETDVEGIRRNITHSPEMSFNRPPSAKGVFYDELKRILNPCNFKREIILMGNFSISWENKTNQLKQLADGFSLNQIIQRLTRTNL